MLRYLPLRSTQSSSSVRVSKYFDSVTHTPVMPSQHLPQLPSEPARHSARSAALTLVAVVPSHVWPLGQAVHSLLRTYLGASHLVITVPSHVWPLGQALHRSSLTYLGAAQHSAHAEQSSVSQPQRSFHGADSPAHQPKQHPMSLQLLHCAHPEQALSSQPQRTFHGSEWSAHQSKQHPVALQLLHSSHPEQALSSQPQRTFHGSPPPLEGSEHQSSQRSARRRPGASLTGKAVIAAGATISSDRAG